MEQIRGGEFSPGEKKVCWQKKSRRLFKKKFSWREFFYGIKTALASRSTLSLYLDSQSIPLVCALT